MGAHGGPKLAEAGELAVYTDAFNQKRGIEAGVGLSANQRTLTKAGNAVRGTYGGVTCITYDGTNDGVDFSPAVSIANNDPWTFVVWFYIGNSSSLHRRHLLCTRASGALTTGNITYYYNTSTDANGNQTTRIRFLISEERTAGAQGQLSLYPGPYGSQYVLTALQNDFWTGQWHHLVIRKGYSSVSRYDAFLNGEYKSGSTRSTGYVNNGLEVNSFGANGNYAGWYGGLGGPKIYTKALSDSRIAKLYNKFKKRYNR